MNLYDAVNNMTFTENGALTNKSSLDACLDLFVMGGASRNKTLEEIEKLVENAWKEDKVTTLSILFYLRDIREGGMGEKRIFREAIKKIAQELDTRAMLTIIPELGSWKDVFEIYPIEKIAPYIKARFVNNHMVTGNYDLMEKYMPSIGGSKNRDAEKLARYMGMTPKQYRKALSKARASLKLVETAMCENRWEEIVYPHVPSKAMLNYKNAFRRHDMVRYSSYLENVKSGKEKINAKTLLPYEITHQYSSPLHYYDNMVKEENETLELLWKNLKEYDCEGDSLVIADVSGSMYGTPMDISTSLAIYFAERNTSIFKDTYITFSDVPKFQKLDRKWSLQRKLEYMYNDNDWGGSTNLQAVFDMILTAAVSNNLPETEMPKTLYIISDMEFNMADRRGFMTDTNYNTIKNKYEVAGYALPNIIFWNVNSRQSNMPVTKNDVGVALVSGCSPSIFEMVTSNKKEMNPVEIMKQAITPYREKATEALI